jgi:hypothetical protein
LYNAGWFVRAAYFGSEERLREACERFAAVLGEQLQSADDITACVFAAADALTCSPLGCPWEA